jgi:perosamine synthetase
MTPTIRLARPDVGDEEIAAVTRVLRGSVLTNGPETEAFEHEFASRHEADHGVAFSNGTVALVGLWMALGLGTGDEVIVPSFTFVSSATSVVLAGATPVFAEVDPDTFNLDPADAAARVTSRTRAILAVHYGGQPCDLAELADLAADAGVALIEDAAEAHGATYRDRSVGTFGRAAMFSFTPTKNMTTGEGGMVLTDGDLAARLRLLRNHGQTELYRHEILGSNWRMTEMQAAMGRAQLAKLDGILARKRAVCGMLTEGLSDLAGVVPPVVRTDRTHVNMLYTVKFPDAEARDRVGRVAAEGGIETRLYFPPAHQQPIFADCGARLPVTEDVASRVLSLPAHSRLEPNEVRAVVAAVRVGVREPEAGARTC